MKDGRIVKEEMVRNAIPGMKLSSWRSQLDNIIRDMESVLNATTLSQEEEALSRAVSFLDKAVSSIANLSSGRA